MNIVRRISKMLMIFLIFFPIDILSYPVESSKIDLSPEKWPKGDLEKAIIENRPWGKPKPEARGDRGMVGGTTQALAVRAGLEALRQGGTAMDAACVTSLTQITLAAGATISYAGIMSIVYYEAKTGKIQALMAPFAIPQSENDPYSIPRSGTASGRTALVPGFMKGIESAHQRFGKLPFSCLFDPAIYFAEKGFVVERPMMFWIRQKQKVLSRRGATRKIFTHKDGRFLALGDRFIQEDLASTLRAVAKEGAAHMYTGKWAHDLVKAVSGEGGKLTLHDLKQYDVLWSEPLHTSYRQYDIFATAAPMIGGRMILESLNLMELADPAQYGRYSESAKSLYWLIQCSRMPHMLERSNKRQIQRSIPGASLHPQKRITKKNALLIWKKMKEWRQQRSGKNKSIYNHIVYLGGHSDGVVAIDREGNIAAMCHTINTDTWGTTGIFVNGISIPDAACFQQSRMKTAGPGGYVPNEMNPLIVMKGKKPILASSSVGSGLHEATLGCLHNILNHNMLPKAAVEQPALLSPFWGMGTEGQSNFHKQVIPAGRYPRSMITEIEEMGQPLAELNRIESQNYRGYWIGIKIDPGTGRRSGGLTSFFNGTILSEPPSKKEKKPIIP